MNSSKNWDLQIDGSVYKFLSKISREDAKRILVAIKNLPYDLFGGDIQKMKGEGNVWRRRIGSYRFRYEIIRDEKIIHVFLAERRTSSSY